ncbi:MAG: aldo/keto reductase [Verrucomicrobia bacterium]|jgi:aryl-alcohol dehydrogenase-like predicted oxidoreductase|nr:aldo/keto reductase [Verrucomicrobiota bacterium]OQC65713.1 MAG: putative oxidoreductase [Verrucomicrobia bacterium ADurb.Bin006]MDI9381188.1 aldo/keto reductase [Verrucomicrobiota bacterium]HOA61737.1 aldo/keto reductase [Verrucomicrobiota bacterium]HOF49283.1 aldo/keto reductase [Verrucomicrobiota bacterium]
MKRIDRRHFLASLAGTSACLYSVVRAQAGPSPDAPPQGPLGKTGIILSRIGQGTGMNGGNRQSNHTRMGFEKLTTLLRHDYDRGITFFDLADLYGSHVYFREVLKSLPRDKVTILTKLWYRYDGQPSQVPADFKRRSTQMAVQRFRHELMTDYLDVVLLHCLDNPEWEEEMRPYMDALAEAKDKKQIRAVGVSCHNFGALKNAANCPWVDVILARINPKGAKMDGPVDEVVSILKTAKANGKALIGMKIYGEGTLAQMKEECMRFATGLGLLDAMTLGAESTEEMDESLRLFAQTA